MVRKKIAFRFETGKELGMGHLFRCLQIMEYLQGMECIAIISTDSELAEKVLSQRKIPYFKIDNIQNIISILVSNHIDILVNDILNTKKDDIVLLKKYVNRIVNFEDVGSGANCAHAVINELYELGSEEKQEAKFYGKDYYCLSNAYRNAMRNVFRSQIKNVAILFGCTDSGNLSEKTLYAILEESNLINICVKLIVGPGKRISAEQRKKLCKGNKDIRVCVVENADLTSELCNIDLAISSQGRTMFELAYMKIPTIVLAQNERETLHTFAALENGFVNLGIGRDVTGIQIAKTVDWLNETPHIRYELYRNMEKLELEKGMERVSNIILDE